MLNPSQSNFKKFFWSPHHGWLFGLTLGLGLISGHLGLLMLGVAAYALGWIYLPDVPIFTNWVKKKEDAIAAQNSLQQAQNFIARRDGLLASLSQERSQRYFEMANVCQDIEKATKDSAQDPAGELDPRLRKLDELMWTYLRLLVLEASLEQFLDVEKEEQLPKAIADAKAETTQLDTEIKAAVAKGENPAAKLRLLESRQERLTALCKRQDRVNEGTENITLVRAEQDRLVEQIKLLRADSIAARNAETLTARIDATVEHLSQTNKIFAEMDQFKDLVAEDLPETTERLGFAPSAPSAAVPPVIPVRGRVSNWK